MPCGQFAANAAYFRICVLAYILYLALQHSARDEAWPRHPVATVCWRLFHLPGKLVRHAGAWAWKVARESLDLLQRIRARGFACAAANRSP